MGNNLFDEIEGHSAVPTSNEQPKVDNNSVFNEKPITDEIDFSNLSDKGVGELKKYERENLDGKTVKILSAKLFNPDTKTEEPTTALSNKDTKYYKTKFILTYNLENKDGVKHREYISGALQYVQKDGSISSPQLYYEGAESQVSDLFVKVAKFKGVEPKSLSPREFMNFLNSGPTVILEWKEVIYMKQKYYKNLVKEFVK